MPPLRRRTSPLESLEARSLLAADLSIGWFEPIDYETELSSGAAEVTINLEQDGLLDLHVMTGGLGVGSADLLDAAGNVVASSVDLPVPLPEIMWNPIELSAGEYTLSVTVAPFDGQPIDPHVMITAHLSELVVHVDPTEPVDEPDDFAGAAAAEGDLYAAFIAGMLSDGDDVDVFTFAFGGEGTLEVMGLPLGPDTGYSAEVFNGDQQLIAAGDSSEAAPLMMSLEGLAYGDYFLRVTGDAASPYMIDLHANVPTDPVEVVDDYLATITVDGPGVDLAEGHAPIDVFAEDAADVDVVRIATPAEGVIQGQIMVLGGQGRVELLDATGTPVGELASVGGPELQLIELEAKATGEDLYLRVTSAGGPLNVHADLIVMGAATAGTPERLAAAAAFDAAFAGLQDDVVQEEVPPLDGDVNRDGVVDLTDFVLLKEAFGSQGDDLAADFDHDGVVGLTDFALLKAAISL